MKDLVDFAAALVSLNGGQMVGKTRFQKTVYLLEELNLGPGVTFDYHNFGPFSADLAFAIDDAMSLGYMEPEERLGFHQIPYTVYRSTGESPLFVEDAYSENVSNALKIIGEYSALELELAATAVFLKKAGFEGYWNEVKKRKPSKAIPTVVARAKELIARVGLR